jgi:hypothetical protein
MCCNDPLDAPASSGLGQAPSSGCSILQERTAAGLRTRLLIVQRGVLRTNLRRHVLPPVARVICRGLQRGRMLGAGAWRLVWQQNKTAHRRRPRSQPNVIPRTARCKRKRLPAENASRSVRPFRAVPTFARGSQRIVGLDIVEVAQPFDASNSITCITAGRLIVNVLGASWAPNGTFSN